MVSIKDVAKHAGVAISTVSKVLNHYPNISETTRKKVNQAVEELNFVPNSVAAALSSKQAGRVALMIDLNVKTQAIDEVAMRYISGAITKAMELNLDVITLFVFMFQDKTTEELIRYLRSQSITGIIVYGLTEDHKLIQDLVLSESFKCVVVDGDNVTENTSSVTIDHKQAQYDVAKKIAETFAPKKILYLSGDEHSYVTKRRMEGMKQAAKEEELELTTFYAEFSEKKAENYVLEHGKEYDAFVCASDLMAVGTRKALLELGYDKPICGFDGISLMKYYGKGIYSIDQNFSDISAVAMAELHRLMSGNQGRNICMDYVLICN